MLKRFRLLSPDTGSNPTSADAPAANVDSTPAQAATNTTPDAQAADGQEPITLEEARRLRSESKALRTRLKAFEDADQATKDAQLTETQKLQKEYTDLKQDREDLAAALLESRVNVDIAKLSSKFNFVIPPELLSQLIDWSAIDVDEETGKPTNVEKLLEKVAKSAPDLVGKQQTSTSGGATNPARSATSNAGALSWEVITQMTPAQYEARRTEIQSWMMHNPMRRY